MTTKSEVTPTRTIENGYFESKGSNWDTIKRDVLYTTLRGGEKHITYADGPKYLNYRCNWKECHQSVRNAWSGDPGGTYFSTWLHYWASTKKPILQSKLIVDRGSLPNGNKDYVLPARRDLLSEAWGKVWNNLNLNSSEAVLLYSGVLQAVPLVGGAFKFVSIMNRAARKLAKSFKKKPFTTVVKTLIQADFIDRFVVSPTIDDARRFLDAHNYVVNVMNTMYQRAQPLPTAISQEASAVLSSTPEKSVESYLGVSSGALHPTRPTCTVRYTERADVTTKVFLLAMLSYNTDAVSPIKLWADRCGITRPLDSIWDLVPFSFVIDYFTRAGDFISGLSDQMAGQDGLRGKIARIVGAYQTTKCRFGTQYSITYPSVVMDNPSYIYTPLVNVNTPGKLWYGSYTFERTPSNPWSYPVSEPSGLVRLDLSTTRLRTLLELIIQAKA